MRANWLLKELPLGATPPRGWGMAWYEPQRRVKVCAPLQLHWLMRWAREALWRFQLAMAAPRRETQESRDMQRRIRESQTLAQEYARGYLAGWRECREACVEAATNGTLDAMKRLVTAEVGAHHKSLEDPELFAGDFRTMHFRRKLLEEAW